MIKLNEIIRIVPKTNPSLSAARQKGAVDITFLIFSFCLLMFDSTCSLSTSNLRATEVSFIFSFNFLRDWRDY